LFPAIVAFPEREVDVFCVHDTVTDPEPLPLSGDTVIHDPFPDADRLPPTHADGEPVTVTSCEPAAAEGLTDVGEIVNEVQVVDVVESS
jgi:hypothetical protein